MSYGMYISATGANAQSHRLEIVSNNLANVDTVGFKREFAVLQARASEAIENGQAAAEFNSVDNVGGGVVFNQSLTDLSTGAIKQTGIATDLAIPGDGYFLVDNEGQQFLTRAGNFQITNDGSVQTQQGYSVLTSDGQPLRIEPGIPWRWVDSGAIEQGGAQVAIGLVRPQNPGDLVKAGTNLFHTLADPVPIDPGERRVLSGYLEHSSAKPVLEMMEQIEALRAYESNVRMIQNHDQTIGALVNRILK